MSSASLGTRKRGLDDSLACTLGRSDAPGPRRWWIPQAIEPTGRRNEPRHSAVREKVCSNRPTLRNG